VAITPCSNCSKSFVIIYRQGIAIPYLKRELRPLIKKAKLQHIVQKAGL
jgi:hypothetical protein